MPSLPRILTSKPIIALCFFLLLGSFAALFYVQRGIGHDISDYFHHYEIKESGLGYTTYQNVALDADEFQKIKTLRITYSSLDPSNISAIHINGLRLDAITLKDLRPLYDRLLSLPAKSIKITGGKASLLHETFGGISLSFDLDIQQSNSMKTLQGRLETIQKNLGFQATLSLQKPQGQSWQGEVEIQKGRLTLDPMNISRLNGIINLHSNGSILSNFKAGGASFHNIPWTNLNGSAELRDQTLKGFIDANALGEENIELTVSMDKNAALITLYSEEQEDMKEFIDKSLPDFSPKIDWNKDAQETGIRLDFLMKTENPGQLYYRPK